MAEQNLEAKLKSRLKQEQIQLWSPPYTDDGQPGRQHLQELAERYAPPLGLPTPQVEDALESIRQQAVHRGTGNRTFRETNVASLELLLPRDSNKDRRTKTRLETRLDVLVQDVVDRIRDEFSLKSIKLILNGKTLCVEQRLDLQGVRNHSKLMVLKLSDGDFKQLSDEEEKKKNQSESVQKTHKCFQILSERDGSEESSPFLEISDQKGNPLKIPHKLKKVDPDTQPTARGPDPDPHGAPCGPQTLSKWQ
ncbi:NEDD8 ultimate buster 1 [Plectropomus leopardus]|uniref:NEDD8 ultimate buster 1 n=1 Tax=Plectropomus leopardus TaxID=160734 RepID=UPI001C4B92B4|nr:NEDD8 ultimate buster 1 [Plectropomus leopardus]